MYFYFFGKIKSIANLSAVRKYKIKNSEKSIEKKKKQKSQTNGSLITIRWILSFDKLDRKKNTYVGEREREKHLPQNKRTFSPFFQKIPRVKINPFHRYVSIFVYRPASQECCTPKRGPVSDRNRVTRLCREGVRLEEE